MSGGSFNYLYEQAPYDSWELERMADDLEARGMHDAEDATRAFIQKRADESLTALWKAVEWHRSCDSSEAEVALAYANWRASRQNVAAPRESLATPPTDSDFRSRSGS